MTSDAIARAKASYLRCQQAPPFFEEFYQRFFELCPEARPMFASTDFKRQHKLLQHAIGLLLSFSSQGSAEPNLLRRVAERHGREDLHVKAEHYGPFLESLIQTAREFDPEFTDADEAAWREAAAPGIAYMRSKS